MSNQTPENMITPDAGFIDRLFKLVRSVGTIESLIFSVVVIAGSFLFYYYARSFGVSSEYYESVCKYFLPSAFILCVLLMAVSLAVLIGAWAGRISRKKKEELKKEEDKRAHEERKSEIISYMIQDGESRAHALTDYLRANTNTLYISPLLSLRWQTFLTQSISHGLFIYSSRQALRGLYPFDVLALTPMGREIFDILRQTRSEGISEEIRERSAELLAHTEKVEKAYHNPGTRKTELTIKTPFDK